MNITDRLADALLADTTDAELECERCGAERTVVRVVLFIRTDTVFAEYRLCRACHTDFHWFMVTSPETPGEPDISSGMIAENMEVDDGPSTT